MTLPDRVPDRARNSRETTKAHSMESEKIVQILDELAEQARIDEVTYRTAAVDADELALTAFSVSCAAVCGKRADELEDISILYRTERKPFRHYFGPLDRAWDWLATCWRRREDMEIVEVCKRRADDSLRAYEHAQGLPLPGNLRIALRYHMAAVKRSQAGFRRLRHQLRQLSHPGDPVTTQSDFHASGT